MNVRSVKTLFLGMALLAMVWVFSGCASCKPGKAGKIGRYTMDVSLDGSLEKASVLVDLVGVPALSLQQWESYEMSKYWEYGNSKRKDAEKVTLSFLADSPLNQTLSVTNEIWKTWEAMAVTHILVLADLPGVHTDKPGTQDSRRQILPLDECRWPKKTEALKVLIKRSGIDILTPPRAFE